MVGIWLAEVANERIHGTTGVKPVLRLAEERQALQALPPAWRGDIAAARPQAVTANPSPRPASVLAHLDAVQPVQHPLAVYDQLLVGLNAPLEVAS